MGKVYDKVYRSMAKVGDGWDKIVAYCADKTLRYGKKVAIVLLAITAAIAVLAVFALPEQVTIPLSFDGSYGKMEFKIPYIVKTCLLCAACCVFILWRKVTLWLVTASVSVLAFTLVVLSNIL